MPSKRSLVRRNEAVPRTTELHAHQKRDQVNGSHILKIANGANLTRQFEVRKGLKPPGMTKSIDPVIAAPMRMLVETLLGNAQIP